MFDIFYVTYMVTFLNMNTITLQYANEKGPTIDPRGISKIISSQSLQDDRILVFSSPV